MKDNHMFKYNKKDEIIDCIWKNTTLCGKHKDSILNGNKCIHQDRCIIFMFKGFVFR